MLTSCLTSGARVVVMKPYCPRFRPGSDRYRGHPLHQFEQYEVESTPREAVSWTANGVSYFIYKFKPDLIDKTRDAKPPPRAEFVQLAAPR